MAYSEYLAERIENFVKKEVEYETKKMMGGLVFMVFGHMCLGISRDKNTDEDRLMIRCGKEHYDQLLKLPGARIMDFTGKPMKGFLHIYPDGFDHNRDLEFWISQALSFNKTLRQP